MKRRLTVKLAKHFFRYDEKSGELIWRLPNNKYKDRTGCVAGCPDNKGYINVMFFWRNYKAHRIIWAIKTGRWPPRQIDHRDTDKTNNRWDNLRLATNQQNHANRGKNKNNTSGFKGVTFNRNSKINPWVARVMVDGRNKHLGAYPTPEEAAVVVAHRHREYFGEFSRT